MNVLVAEYVRFGQQFADRFERLAPDADGVTCREDKAMLRKFRRHLREIAKLRPSAQAAQ